MRWHLLLCSSLLFFCSFSFSFSSLLFSSLLFSFSFSSLLFSSLFFSFHSSSLSSLHFSPFLCSSLLFSSLLCSSSLLFRSSPLLFLPLPGFLHLLVAKEMVSAVVKLCDSVAEYCGQSFGSREIF